jgi:hypothetical protein
MATKTTRREGDQHVSHANLPPPPGDERPARTKGKTAVRAGPTNCGIVVPRVVSRELGTYLLYAGTAYLRGGEGRSSLNANITYVPTVHR